MAYLGSNRNAIRCAARVSMKNVRHKGVFLVDGLMDQKGSMENMNAY